MHESGYSTAPYGECRVADAGATYPVGVPLLPLFPLGTVLCPGARLPLRVFEPRYVAMLGDLATGPQPGRFGVVAIRSGHEVGRGNARALHRIGTTALLTSVEQAADGTYDVETVGERRFALRGLSDDPRAPYHVGSVEWLAEPRGDADRVADRDVRVRTGLVQYRKLFGADDSATLALLPNDPNALSHRVGELFALTLEDRQALLACESTAERLGLAVHLLRREHTLVRRLRAVPGAVPTPPISAN